MRDNPLIRHLRDVPALFTHDYWAPTMEVGLYRPLVTTSYALDYALAERSPRGYHLTNIAADGLVNVLVWALYVRLTADPFVAAAGLLSRRTPRTPRSSPTWPGVPSSWLPSSF